MYEILEHDGYELVPGYLAKQDFVALERELEAAPIKSYHARKNGAKFAIRNVHLQLPALRPLLEQGRLHSLATEVLGPEVKLVNATLFDKLPGANWFVPPHQDLLVPVSGETDDDRWTNRTQKANIIYIEPPQAAQDQLLAVRVHLDKCPGDNGALEVVPATHHSRFSEEEIAKMDERSFEICPAGYGEILLMKPLLVHRSRAAKLPQRRRVLHVVYSAATLPDGLKWT